MSCSLMYFTKIIQSYLARTLSMALHPHPSALVGPARVLVGDAISAANPVQVLGASTVLHSKHVLKKYTGQRLAA